MMVVQTYKALGHTIFLYGFKPLDFFVVIVCSLLVVITVNYILGIACFIGLLVAAKKLKHRPGGYFSSLFLFFVTPERLAVRPESDIMSYKDILRNADKSNNH